MALRGFALGIALLAVSQSLASAQTDDKAENVGTAAAVSESQKLTILPKGCAAFSYTNNLSGFNYTAKLGLAKLPAGCDEKLIRVLKQYTSGSCPETRDNNYKVFKTNDKCNDPIVIANNQTCTNVFQKAPPSAYAPKGIGAASTIDAGTVCWLAPKVFYFIDNQCTTPITAVIKVTRDVYKGSCKDESDSDDGGDDAGGAGTEKAASSGSLSGGAIAGIVIGVLVGVAVIATAVWFFCCQLGKS